MKLLKSGTPAVMRFVATDNFGKVKTVYSITVNVSKFGFRFILVTLFFIPTFLCYLQKLVCGSVMVFFIIITTVNGVNMLQENSDLKDILLRMYF
jgi:hypothetical protein